jgi:hypothetical protein
MAKSENEKSLNRRLISARRGIEMAKKPCAGIKVSGWRQPMQRQAYGAA